VTLPLRNLGRTERTVSVIGLGLAALGRPGYINLDHRGDLPQRDVEGMERRCHDVLDSAWEAGVRYVDAARSYGRAEEFLASWLRSRHRASGEPVVGSKWGYTYTAAWRVDVERHEVKDHSLDALRRQFAESRAILGDHLALYQIHSATPESGVLDDASVLAALARLRDSGVAVGVSVSGVRQADAVRRAIDIHIDGRPLFDTVQATWNLLERSAEAALAEARDAGLAVIVKEVLANGRLTEHNRDPSFASQRRILEGIAARLGATLDSLALSAALHRRWSTVVLSGAATVDQLAANLRAVDVAWDDAAGAELGILVEDARDYWATRAALPWN